MPDEFDRILNDLDKKYFNEPKHNSNSPSAENPKMIINEESNPDEFNAILNDLDRKYFSELKRNSNSPSLDSQKIIINEEQKQNDNSVRIEKLREECDKIEKKKIVIAIIGLILMILEVAMIIGDYVNFYIMVPLLIALLVISFMIFLLDSQEKDISVKIRRLQNVNIETSKPTRFEVEYALKQNKKMLDRIDNKGKTKDKSVIGSALIGSLIAGQTGAIIGAMHAMDENNKKRHG